MTQWIDAVKQSELPEGSRKVVNLPGVSLLIFNLAGNYYAIKNECTHENFPLEEGELSGNTITCPFHGAEFCIITGAVKAPPAFEDLEVYKTRVENEMIQVAI